MARRARLERPLRFDERLVLYQWMLELFEVSSFDKLAKEMREPEREGFSEDNVSRFYHFLNERFFDRKELSADVLLGYDQNIVRHWKKITEKRNLAGNIIYPKYFQYFSLLLAEIYLDRYFTDPEKLLADLNKYVERFNEGHTPQLESHTLFASGLPASSQINPYDTEDLNKLAYWSATGSGKTLLMHVNILQYKHYLEQHSRERELNRIILLTPNEGLSQQHLVEFSRSDMDAELFSKDGRGLFSGGAIEVIDIHKLRETSGEKTVAVDAFEHNNLVLVDEGHRGASGAERGRWMEMRRRLCENGFSFEYSATFGQAVKGNKNLEQEYARCTIFDYSYKYFYKDGYGKEYRILNLEDDSDESIRRRYLTACLLAFYQQQKLYSDREPEFRRFLIERPLWTFVGGSVNAVRTRSGRKVSDVTDILLFLAHFIGNRDESVSYLDLFLKGQSGLLDASGNDTFARVFTYLYKQGFNGEQVFDDILNVMFNASSPASLHVENLKGTDGEIALHLGNNEPFGVINVGDATALCNLCEEYDELVVTDREFSGSLFHGLSDLDSEINILIGSKKFTEGWNSWRVSTMGMMNIGRSEGPQIIQLFGRGVRLKGLNLCLKRSRRIPGIKAPDDIDLLETLNIFGIRADYMRQFKEYLEEEGLPANEDRIEFVLPVIKNLGTNRLKMIRLPENIDFKRDGQKPTLELIDKFLKGSRITLDWYPRIQTLSSPDGETGTTVEKHESYFTEKHLAFMDVDEIYFDLQRFKNERGWSNLNLLRPEVGTLLNAHGWYRLYIPEEEMEFRTFEQVGRWQEIATVLLKKYCDRYYKFRKSEYEDKHLEYRELTTDDPNFIEDYRFLIEQSKEDIIAKLEELKDLVTSGELRDWEFHDMRAIRFVNHLYSPLIYVNSDLVEVKPVILAEPGERDFVLDLQKFCQGHREFFHDKELYLLRNLSRGRGIGFFEAGNFHPDFILWLLSNDRQYISFVDPKGITRLEGLEDPKISFHKTIKELEDRLGDSSVTLNSFIVSSTLPSDVSWWDGGITKTELERKNVLFQYEDRDTYVGKLLAKAEYR